MTEEQKNKLKHIHANYLAMPETSNLLRNLRKKLEEDLDSIMAHSVLNTMPDSQLRTKCAKAQAMKELIDYVSKEPNCIVG